MKTFFSIILLLLTSTAWSQEPGSDSFLIKSWERLDFQIKTELQRIFDENTTTSHELVFKRLAPKLLETPLASKIYGQGNKKLWLELARQNNYQFVSYLGIVCLSQSDKNGYGPDLFKVMINEIPSGPTAEYEGFLMDLIKNFQWSSKDTDILLEILGFNYFDIDRLSLALGLLPHHIMIEIAQNDKFDTLNLDCQALIFIYLCDMGMISPQEMPEKLKSSVLTFCDYPGLARYAFALYHNRIGIELEEAMLVRLIHNVLEDEVTDDLGRRILLLQQHKPLILKNLSSFDAVRHKLSFIHPESKGKGFQE